MLVVVQFPVMKQETPWRDLESGFEISIILTHVILGGVHPPLRALRDYIGKGETKYE